LRRLRRLGRAGWSPLRISVKRRRRSFLVGLLLEPLGSILRCAQARVTWARSWPSRRRLSPTPKGSVGDADTARHQKATASPCPGQAGASASRFSLRFFAGKRRGRAGSPTLSSDVAMPVLSGAWTRSSVRMASNARSRGGAVRSRSLARSSGRPGRCHLRSIRQGALFWAKFVERGWRDLCFARERSQRMISSPSFDSDQSAVTSFVFGRVCVVTSLVPPDISRLLMANGSAGYRVFASSKPRAFAAALFQRGLFQSARPPSDFQRCFCVQRSCDGFA